LLKKLGITVSNISSGLDKQTVPALKEILSSLNLSIPSNDTKLVLTSILKEVLPEYFDKLKKSLENNEEHDMRYAEDIEDDSKYENLSDEEQRQLFPISIFDGIDEDPVERRSDSIFDENEPDMKIFDEIDDENDDENDDEKKYEALDALKEPRPRDGEEKKEIDQIRNLEDYLSSYEGKNMKTEINNMARDEVVDLLLKLGYKQEDFFNGKRRITVPNLKKMAKDYFEAIPRGRKRKPSKVGHGVKKKHRRYYGKGICHSKCPTSIESECCNKKFQINLDWEHGDMGVSMMNRDAMESKLKIIIGELDSGNNSKLLKNQLGHILQALFSKKAITKSKVNKITKKYILDI